MVLIAAGCSSDNTAVRLFVVFWCSLARRFLVWHTRSCAAIDISAVLSSAAVLACRAHEVTGTCYQEYATLAILLATLLAILLKSDWYYILARTACCS